MGVVTVQGKIEESGLSVEENATGNVKSLIKSMNIFKITIAASRRGIPELSKRKEGHVPRFSGRSAALAPAGQPIRRPHRPLTQLNHDVVDGVLGVFCKCRGEFQVASNPDYEGGNNSRRTSNIMTASPLS